MTFTVTVRDHIMIAHSFTGPGKSPSWNGARIRSRSLGGTCPRKTDASVPRLTPVHRVRTSTSPSPAPAIDSRRRPPTPGSSTQKATASRTDTSPSMNHPTISSVFMNMLRATLPNKDT